jgi:PAS domain S-box-containing protein
LLAGHISRSEPRRGGLCCSVVAAPANSPLIDDKQGIDSARDVLENMLEAFFLLDQEFRLLDVNGAAIALNGRPQANLIGRTLWDLTPGLEQTELGAIFHRSWSIGRADAIYITKSGQTVTAHGSSHASYLWKPDWRRSTETSPASDVTRALQEAQEASGRELATEPLDAAC